ncbi:hypothetical protein ABPG73_018101 [Tetrahymena malaccensis]
MIFLYFLVFLRVLQAQDCSSPSGYDLFFRYPVLPPDPQNVLCLNLTNVQSLNYAIYQDTTSIKLKQLANNNTNIQCDNYTSNFIEPNSQGDFLITIENVAPSTGKINAYIRFDALFDITYKGYLSHLLTVYGQYNQILGTIQKPMDIRFSQNITFYGAFLTSYYISNVQIALETDCAKGCSKCTLDNFCVQCQQNFVPQNKTVCSPKCAQNQFYNSFTNICQNCQQQCTTCLTGSPAACQSCSPLYFPVLNSTSQTYFECTQYCPNNYELQNNICQPCNQTIYSNCLNCGNTCRSCSISNKNICKDCNNGMKLNASNICQCFSKDTRNLNFYYCSYQNIAVVQVTFSNQTPQITLEFGLTLLYQDIQCKQIFAQITLDLIGNSNCTISQSQIIVDLGDYAQIMANDTISFNLTQKKLQFNDETVPIDTIYIISVQQQPVTPQVLIKFNQVENTCNDIVFQIQQVTNDLGRGFHYLEWDLLNPQNFDKQTLQNINTIIQNTNTKQNQILSFTKLLFPPNTNIAVQLYYVMKVQYSNTQTFNTLTQQSKQIFVSYLQNIYKPINRFMDLKIQFNFFSQICGQQEQIIIKDIYDIQLVSSTLPQLTQNFKSFKDNQITIEVKPFSVPINTDLDIQFSISDVDKTLSASQTLSLAFQQRNLQILIQNGVDMLVDYKTLSPGIKVSQNSVTKPFIKNVNNTYSPNLDNALLLNFPNVKPSQNNLTCVQLQPQQVWSNSKCKLFKPDKSNVYTCLCDNQQPTTIIEDIQSLYNNNLQTALSSKGLQNISNFKSFYEYAVF